MFSTSQEQAFRIVRVMTPLAVTTLALLLIVAQPAASASPLALQGLELDPDSSLAARALATEWRVCLAGCAYSSIQAAVDAASDGDVIKVAAGIYTDTNTYHGSRQALYISKTITVSGGYTTTNWTTPYPITQPTTLDAGGQGRVVYITGLTPTIEGLHITGGNVAGANSEPGGPGSGGGIYIIASAAVLSNCRVFSNTALLGGGLYLGYSATLINNIITSNTAAVNGGGGLYLFNSHATLTGNSIYSNTAMVYYDEYGFPSGGQGGGLHLYNSSATLVSNVVQGNKAGNGGGLLLVLSNAMLIDNTVQDNWTSITVGGKDVSVGGGLLLDSSHVTLNGNTIADNSASACGGGLYVTGSDATFTHNTVANNQAYRFTLPSGGGLCLGNSTAAFTGDTIAGNWSMNGGGVASWSSNLTLTNVIVNSNRGNGISNSGNLMLANVIVHSNDGDGISSSGNSRLANVTFHGNRGYGIAHDDGSLTLINSIVWGNSLDQITSTADSTPTVLYSDVQGGYPGVGNIDADPRFVAPVTTTAISDALGNYRLHAKSPAIDAGNSLSVSVSTDQDGNPRIMGAAVDMGAYEVEINTLTPTPNTWQNLLPEVCARIWFTDTGVLPSLVVVTLTHDYPSAHRDGLPRRYDITAVGGNDYQARLELCYEDEELAQAGIPVERENDLHAYRWDGGTRTWITYTEVDTLTNRLIADDVQQFGVWGLGVPTNRPTEISSLGLRATTGNSTPWTCALFGALIAGALLVRRRQ